MSSRTLTLRISPQLQVVTDRMAKINHAIGPGMNTICGVYSRGFFATTEPVSCAECREKIDFIIERCTAMEIK